MNEPEDRFARLASGYDRWIGWEPRLRKEMPFLTASLPAGAAVLDAGCGTGAHAIALDRAGYRVLGLDQSPAMLGQARAVPSSVEWVEGDLLDPALLPGRRFDAVLALGNALLSLREEEKVERGLRCLIDRTAPGGLLILQYLNGTRIRRHGRLVVKAAPPDESSTDVPGGASKDASGEIWLRHHFAAGEDLYFHSYVLHREGGAWTAEVRADRVVDLPPARILPLLTASFHTVEFFDGLTGKPFDAEESDAVGVRAHGKR